MKYTNNKILIFIFLFFVLLNSFIFRSFFIEANNLVSGKMVVVWEELIPIFDIKTQFLNQLNGGFSELTQSMEGRVGYSALTSWSRYYKILPFSVILLNSLSAFFIFLSIFIFSKMFFKRDAILVAYFSLISSLVVYLPILYSKITHFYTLIFGFSLFTLALTLFLVSVYSFKKINWLTVILISTLVFINPAIHFHILFYIIQFVLLFLIVFRVLYLPGLDLRNITISTLLIFLLSFLPYVSIMLFTLGGDGAQNFPVNYYSIKYSSMDFINLFLFDSASQINMGLYGKYISSNYKIFNILLMIFFLLPSFFVKKITKQQRVIYLTFFMSFLIFLNFSLGYNFKYSFYNLIDNFVVFLSSFNSAIADFFLKLFYIALNVLRLPHRFQFVLYYALGIILPFSFYLINQKVKNKFIGIFLPLVVIMPFIISTDYRKALSSGDFNGFLKPWPVEKELSEIKKVIEKEGSGIIFMLPSMESGRAVKLDTGQVNYFIDKYYAYYLNSPTLYYGTAADVENKAIASMVYRGISYNEEWWKNYLLNFTDVNYILLNKMATGRAEGMVYYPSLEERLTNDFMAHDRIKLIFSSDNFDLYKINKVESGKNCLVDMEWNNFLVFNRSDIGWIENEKFFTSATLKNDIKINCLISDDSRKGYLDFYALNSKNKFYGLPEYYYVLSDNIISSSLYSNSFFSLSTMFDKNNKYNYFQETIPGLHYSLYGNFFGLKQGSSEVKIPFSVEKKDESALLLRSMNNDALIDFKIVKDGKILFEKNGYSLSQINNNSKGFNYNELYRGVLEPGNYYIEVINAGERVVVGDGLLVAAKKDLPDLFGDEDALFFDMNINNIYYNLNQRKGDNNKLYYFDIETADESRKYKLSENLLIDNSSFEDGLWNESVSDCSRYADGESDMLMRIVDDAFMGASALELSSNNHHACTYKKFKVSLKKNKFYQLTFNYKNLVGGRLKYYYRFGGADKSIAKFEEFKAKNTDWAVIKRLIISDNEYDYFYLYLYSPSSGEEVVNLYDNVELREVIYDN